MPQKKLLDLTTETACSPPYIARIIHGFLFREFFRLRRERPEGTRNHGHRMLNIDVHRPYLWGIFCVAALGGKVVAGSSCAGNQRRRLELWKQGGPLHA